MRKSFDQLIDHVSVSQFSTRETINLCAYTIFLFNLYDCDIMFLHAPIAKKLKRTMMFTWANTEKKVFPIKRSYSFCFCTRSVARYEKDLSEKFSH